MASRPLTTRSKVGISAGAATALALAVVALKSDEGKRNVSYLDIANVPTSCYGHTGRDVKVGQYRTDSQCETLLSIDVQMHLEGVLQCSPELNYRPYQLAAATRLAFNIGIGAYCGTDAAGSVSGIARKFAAGQTRAACDGFMAWNKARVNGKLQVVRGLTLRRERERAQCLTGVG